MTTRCGVMFCVCDRCCVAINEEHAAANVACGREPQACACGLCKIARRLAEADIERRFKRSKSLKLSDSASRCSAVAYWRQS